MRCLFPGVENLEKITFWGLSLAKFRIVTMVSGYSAQDGLRGEKTTKT